MRRALAAIALALAVPNLALAHAGPPTLEQIEADPNDPMHLIAGTNFGTLVSHDGGASWQWICREALRASLDVTDPVVAIADDGALFVADGAGLWRGTPDGCDWQLADPVFSGAVPTLTRGAPHELFAGTAVDEGNNALYRSRDDGRTWQPVLGPTFRVFYESVVVAPGDRRRVYAIGTLPPVRVEPWQPTVYRSDDGGDTWTSVDYAIDPAEWHLFLVGVDPTDVDRVVLHTQDLHTGGHDRVITSEDGARTFAVTQTLTQVLAGRWAPDGSALWIGGPLDGIWRSDDAGRTFAAIHPGLDVRGFFVRDGGLWVTGTQAFDGFAIARSSDGGATLETLRTLSAIDGVARCAAASSVGTACLAHEGTLDGALQIPDAGPPDTGASDAASAMDAGSDAADAGPAPRGCTCTVPGPTSPRRAPALSFAVWLAASLAIRRRRRGR